MHLYQCAIEQFIADAVQARLANQLAEAPRSHVGQTYGDMLMLDRRHADACRGTANLTA